MTSYFSTFITGLSEVVEQQLKKDVPDVKIKMLLDGLVVYQTDEPIQKVKSIPYFNNSFLLLKHFPITPPGRAEGIVRKLASEIDFKEALRHLALTRNNSFRLIISKENQMIGVDKGITRAIEDRVLSSTRLQLSPLKADVELWFLLRSEDHAFFGARLTGLATVATKPEKGELRPELAHLLCALSEPDGEDVFIDPFCGNGSIVFTRAHVPYSQIIAGDRNLTLVKTVQEKARTKQNIDIYPMDGTSLTRIKDQSIDKIVTDPPWGFYEGETQKIDIHTLYTGMLKEFQRILKPEGKIVILTARKELLEDILMHENGSSLKLQNKYDILVSGKKAGVYVLVGNAK